MTRNVMNHFEVGTLSNESKRGISMKAKQSWRQFKKRIFAVDQNTPEKEIANLILMGCNRIRSGDKAPAGYSDKWDYVIMHIARRWNGSKR